MARDLQARAWGRTGRTHQRRAFLDTYEIAKEPTGAITDYGGRPSLCDRLDPLTSSTRIKNELEPSDEVLEELIEQERAREKGSR
jgi:hypothetical protein